MGTVMMLVGRCIWHINWGLFSTKARNVLCLEVFKQTLKLSTIITWARFYYATYFLK